MNRILTITKKELASFFNSPIAYIFLIVFLIVPSFFFWRTYFLVGLVETRSFFDLIALIYLLMVPAITMRSWAEEKKSGTVELLLTMPIQDHEVVLAKFLSSFLFLSIGLALSFIVPLFVAYTGSLEWGVLFTSYLGVWLMGGAYIALGVWISAMTENQIIAFILSLFACVFFYLIGQVGILFTLPSFLIPVFRFLGLTPHYESIVRGVVDSRDLIYYLSFIGFFLFLNVQQISGRRFK